MNFASPGDRQVKFLKSEKRNKNKYLHLVRDQKTMEHEGDGDTNCNWCTLNNPQKIGQCTWKLRNQRISRGHPKQ